MYNEVGDGPPCRILFVDEPPRDFIRITPDQDLNFRIDTPFISDKMTFLRARLSSTFASGVKNLSSKRFTSSLSSKLSIDKVDVKGKRV